MAATSWVPRERTTRESCSGAAWHTQKRAETHEAEEEGERDGEGERLDPPERGGEHELGRDEGADERPGDEVGRAPAPVGEERVH